MSASKKRRNSNKLSPDPDAEDWVNMQGEIGGLPAFVRVNVGVKKLAPHPDYGHEILVSSAFNTAQENGLPASEEDLSQVDEIEELCKTELEKGQTALLVLVVTSGGVRELYFYSSDPEDAIRRWEAAIQPRIQTHEVEFRVRPDPDWEVYQQFA
jgi:hypothetical protein